MMKLLKWGLLRIGRVLYAKEWQHLLQEARRVILELEKVPETHQPPYVLQAMLVTGEDHRFHSHFGIDFIAVCRASWRTIVCGHREGASTIEMQLVRVLTGHYERKIPRKIREAFLAVLLSGAVPKSDISRCYLYIAYYGTWMQGFPCAIKRLGIKACEMNIRQAAYLAARLKYPEPKIMSYNRRRQINVRTDYLVSRYGVYFKQEPICQPIRQESRATI
jgi:penicillin-binding protein 1A